MNSMIFRIERELFPRLAHDHKLFGMKMNTNYWWDVGTMSSYMKAEHFFINSKRIITTVGGFVKNICNRLGYVSLPLSSLFAVKNDVVGFEVDSGKIESIRKGNIPIREPDFERYFKSAIFSGKLKVTTDPSEIKYADVCKGHHRRNTL